MTSISDPKPLTIPESIELAKRFLGFPYLWGGRSSFGFDCSGFTQMLVRARGINMPRDADQQAAWTGVIAIDRKDLQPGDLLFFGSSPKEITHTGMFIGDGQFIHDTTNGHPVVQISRLDDDPWTQVAGRHPESEVKKRSEEKSDPGAPLLARPLRETWGFLPATPMCRRPPPSRSGEAEHNSRRTRA